METSVQTPSSETNHKLTDEQREFILHKIAAFFRLSEIVAMFRFEFPKSGLSDEETYDKVRYLITASRNGKWRDTVDEYREELRRKPLTRFPIANSFERIRILQKVVDTALEPGMRRILWYPIRKDRDGTLHYGREEIWEPNYNAALRAIILAKHELKKDA